MRTASLVPRHWAGISPLFFYPEGDPASELHNQGGRIAAYDLTALLARCIERRIELLHIQPGRPMQNACRKLSRQTAQ